MYLATNKQDGAYDGCISVVRPDSKKTLITTRVPQGCTHSALRMFKILSKHAETSGFIRRVDDFDVGGDGDNNNVLIRATLSADHTQKYLNERVNEFKGLIKRSGIFERPMVCRIGLQPSAEALDREL